MISSYYCCSSMHQRYFSSCLLPFVLMVEDAIELTKKTLTISLNIFFEEIYYNEFRCRIESKDSYLYIKDENGERKEKILGVLGKGGSKKAVLLEQGRALLVPNCDVDQKESVMARWDRIVNEEVKMSNTLNSIGLLSPISKKVNLCLSPNTPETFICAYICESFESLAQTKNLFIIDSKNPKSSTWENSLFDDKKDHLDEEKWDNALSELLSDIAKIFLHQIPIVTDSLNVAIQKKTQVNTNPESSTTYKARYFGFDFSSKVSQLRLPDFNPQAINRESVKYVVRKLVDNVINYEFKSLDVQNITFKGGESFHQFFDRLEEKYTDKVILLIMEASQ